MDYGVELVIKVIHLLLRATALRVDMQEELGIGLAFILSFYFITAFRLYMFDPQFLLSSCDLLSSFIPFVSRALVMGTASRVTSTIVN